MEKEQSDEKNSPADLVEAKFGLLRQTILAGSRNIGRCRQDFLDACIERADALRVRAMPGDANFAERIVRDFTELVSVRDQIIDWVLLESEAAFSEDFVEELLLFMERLRELKLRPNEVTSWNEVWFEAHKLFVYDTFLYTVAALLKTRSYQCLHDVFFERFLRSKAEPSRNDPFCRYDDFYAYSEIINSVLAPPGQKLHSPAAELLKRNSERKDLSFGDVMQADLLALVIALVDPEVRWYPQTLHYSRSMGSFPFFLRATQHKYYSKLAIITGVPNGDTLRIKVKEGMVRLGVATWHNFMFNRGFLDEMNLDKLDTVK